MEPSPPFTFDIGRSPDAVVVTLHGGLDRSNVAPLERILRDLIDDQGNLQVVVDLRDLSTVDPAAVEVFLAASRWARRHRASFRLYRPPARVAEELLGSGVVEDLEIVH